MTTKQIYAKWGRDDRTQGRLQLIGCFISVKLSKYPHIVKRLMDNK